MRLQIQSSAASRNRPVNLIPRDAPKHPRKYDPLFWIILIFIFAFIGYELKPFLEKGVDGNLQLSKWRQQKLERELNELDEAEQYVLLALVSGEYPCYSCANTATIDLVKGHVWKYGYTTKSEKGRYQNSLKDQNLIYMIQHEGTITECMKEEKRKIYFYALLPENLTRAVPLIRPPGNKQDN